MMDEKKEELGFEEVLDDEIDDIWDLFFPYMVEKKEKVNRLNSTEQSKPRKSLKFLSM